MRLAIYPGSFNPFHRGHYNILVKAATIFDRVIIAKGVNPEKESNKTEIPLIISNNFSVIQYDGLLTNCIEKVKYDLNETNITVIRGLRNSVDLQHEMNQYRFLQDLMPDIQLISIFCDKEYEHISSSAIRMLQKYGDDKVKNYLLE